MTLFRHYPTRGALLLLIAAAALTGCDRSQPRVYFERKEAPKKPAAETADDPHGQVPESAPMPKLSGTVPDGWKDQGPDEKNVARFEAGAAVVNVTPLTLPPDKELFLVNIMRDLFGQPPLSEADAAKALTEIPIADGKGKIFDFTGEKESSGATKGKVRIVTGIFHRKGVSWLFKLQGSPEGVEAQMGAFKEFLASVKFEAASAVPASAPAPEPAAPNSAPPAAPAKTAPVQPGDLPAGWTSVAPGAMQAAKFTVPDKDGAKAEVTVSIFPSDTGGVVPNLRRWRGQLNLADTDDATILASAKPLEGGPKGAVYVELENAGRALTGAIVPREGRWFFFKLMGGTPAVAAARESFIVFARGQ